jgi:hypothetical protein
MNKITLFFILVLFLFLSACNIPQYKWVNSSYSPTLVQQNLVIDQRDCGGKANAVYPELLAVRSPNEVYRQCISRPFVRREVVRVPDYAAYARNSPVIMQAYANRKDRNLSLQAWGKRSYLNNGRANGRTVPTKVFVTFPVCDDLKHYQQYQYNEYARTVSIQRSNRSEYVSSCMSFLGWERVLVEESSSSGSGEATRLITERHANGQKSKEGNIINGQSEGLWTEWDESGNVVFQGNYLHGKKDGPWVEYWNNGKKRNETIFDNGNLQNETHWEEDGNICSERC